MTLMTPSEAMVEATIRILLEQIETREVQRKAAVLPARLIVRSSARVPEGRASA